MVGNEMVFNKTNPVDDDILQLQLISEVWKSKTTSKHFYLVILQIQVWHN